MNEEGIKIVCDEIARQMREASDLPSGDILRHIKLTVVPYLAGLEAGTESREIVLKHTFLYLLRVARQCGEEVGHASYAHAG